MLICCEPDIKLDKSQLFEAFDKINETIEDMFTVKGPVTLCSKLISDLLIEWHEKKFPNLSFYIDSCFHYYMTEDQMKRLLEDTKDGIALPEGYYWDEADPEKDAEILCETWQHAGPRELEGMR